jgi:DNA polymerase III subunit epsilon
MDINAARTNAIIKARDYEIRSPLFLDTETTGIGNHAEIIEIAIVNHDGQQVFQSLVKPIAQIPTDATRVHGITNAEVQHSPGWNVIWPEVSNILSGNYAGMYNSEYDMRLMRQSTLAHKLSWEDGLFKDFCVMKLFAEFAGEWNDYHQDFRWFTLEKAALRCRLPLPTLHRALADTQLTRAVFSYIAGCTPALF